MRKPQGQRKAKRLNTSKLKNEKVAEDTSPKEKASIESNECLGHRAPANFEPWPNEPPLKSIIFLACDNFGFTISTKKTKVMD